jgi:hypothetical protein
MVSDGEDARRRLVEVLCRPHCAFFKPWKIEEERCAGYEWFLDRAAEWAGGLEALEPLAGSRVELRHDSLLEETLCSSCPFREADCDFRDPHGPEGAVPCGGVVAVDALLIRGELRPVELSRFLEHRGPARRAPKKNTEKNPG